MKPARSSEISLGSVVLVCFGSCCCGLAVAASAKATATVDEVRQANAAALKAVQTARVEYTYEEPSIFKSSGHESASMPSKPGMVYVARTRREIETCISIPRLQWKTSTQVFVLRNSSVPERNLDMSSVTLEGSGLIVHVPGTMQVITAFDAAPRPGPLQVQSLLHLGLLEESFFRDVLESSTTPSSLDDRPMLSVTVQKHQGKSVAEIDPAIGYRYRKIRHYSAEGKLVEISTAGDYRLVNGMYYPFAWKSYSYDSSDKVTKHERVLVHSVTLNQPLPADALKLILPSGSSPRISLIYRGEPRGPGESPPQASLPVDTPQTLGVGDLKAMIENYLAKRRQSASAVTSP